MHSGFASQAASSSHDRHISYVPVKNHTGRSHTDALHAPLSKVQWANEARHVGASAALELQKLSIKLLKDKCREYNLNASQCVEKTDLVNLLLNPGSSPSASPANAPHAHPASSQQQHASSSASAKPKPAPKPKAKLAIATTAPPPPVAVANHAAMDKKTYDVATIVARIMKESDKKNNFAVLGLKRTAKEAEVKKAHRDLARQLHPDKISSLNIPNADV